MCLSQRRINNEKIQANLQVSTQILQRIGLTGKKGNFRILRQCDHKKASPTTLTGPWAVNTFMNASLNKLIYMYLACLRY